LKKERAVLQQQLETKQNELNSVLEEKEGLTKQIESFTAERNNYIQKMADERAEFEDKANAFLIQEKAKLQFKLDALERQKQNLEKQLTQRTEEVKEANAKGKATTGDVKAKLEMLRAENENLSKRLEAATLDIQRLTRQLEEKEEESREISKLEEQLEAHATTAKSQLETIRSIDRSHRETLEQKETLEGQISHLNKTIEDLQMTIENLQHQFGLLQVELQERTQQCSLLEDRNGQLEIEIEELKVEVQTASEELSAARRNAQVSQEKLEAAMKEREDQISKIERLEAQQMKLGKKLDTIKRTASIKNPITPVSQALFSFRLGLNFLSRMTEPFLKRQSSPPERHADLPAVPRLPQR
jgi:chromosome segregation ATPase